MTAYTYDNRDRTTKVYLDSDEDGIADTAEAQVAYLYANNRLSGIDTASTDYTFTYDVFGNVLSVKAGNYTLATYQYASNNGKLLKLTYGNGDYEEYVYDYLERITEVKLNGTTEYVIAYNANGNIYSITESGTTHVYEYDSLGRLIRAWQKDENGDVVLSVENTYDDLGRAKGSAYALADKDLEYEVDYKTNSNLVDSLSMPRSANGGIMSAILYDYDDFERLTEKEISLSSLATFYEEYSYYGYTATTADGPENRTTSLVSTVTHRVSPSSGTETSVVYSYTYDNLGNITQIRKNGVITNEYTYDNLGQLVCEEDAVAGVTYIYSYDKAGNITKKDKYPYHSGTLMADYTSYLADYKETYATYGYTNTTWGDLLTSYNGTSITYDAIGNPTKWRNAAGLTWEARELQRADLATNSYVDYTYNSDGIRTSRAYVDANTKYREDRTYILDGSKIIQENIKIATISTSTNATLYYLYDVSGEVQGFIYNNSYYYFQKNLQGDVVRILNSSGTVVTEYTYDAWGKVLTTTGSMASTVGKYNPFRYRSYYYDTETGFYYLQSRYYDPTVGRFLNADGIVGANGGIEGYNMFAYCNNSPIIHADFTGYDAVVLTDEEGTGHLGIMVQDEEGQWYHFYWGASDSILPNYMSSMASSLLSSFDSTRNGFPSILSVFWVGSRPDTWYREYNGEITLDAINASGQYEGSYHRMTYLTGDFSTCVDLIMNPTDIYGRYNLFHNNCSQVSLDILSTANTIYKSALKKAANVIVPKSAHKTLRDNMPGEPSKKGPEIIGVISRVLFYFFGGDK